MISRTRLYCSWLAGGPRRVTLALLVALVSVCHPLSVHAQMTEAGAPGQPPRPGTMLQKAGFDQRLGETIPLNLTFRDESGAIVQLSDYFGKRPVILTLVYYRCPMLCGQSLVSLTRSLRSMNQSVGEDFEIVTVSFDAKETPDLAQAKKQAFLEHYDRPRAYKGWHFLTGDQASIDALAESVGFRYVFNGANGQFAHAAGLVILSPSGLITRYFLDIDYPPKEIQSSLAKANAGVIGAAVGQILMLCYDYDPNTGKYTLAVMRILQFLGIITALFLISYVSLMLWRERQTGRLTAPSSGSIGSTSSVAPAHSEPVVVASSAGGV